MFEMFLNSATLFIQGRLFRDIKNVFKQACIGMAIAVFLLIVLVKIGLPLWLAIILTSLVSGGIQPYLFKDLKYA
ncbi:MAG: hypothetical protein L3J75_02900 [Methylococcaceae bacterium]|nr:hypothetical protein [Methylococcaceae bacterium]